MDEFYKITIPEPCHEDWNGMSSNEKGRFCNSCSKTVIDFTKMGLETIQEFIHNNQYKKLCGHFKQDQLDSINLKIPFQVIKNSHSFYKTFLFILLIVMGTSLFSCTNNNGKQQKIQSIEIIDSTNNKIINILDGIKSIHEEDSIVNNETIPPPINTIGDIVTVQGIIDLEDDPNQTLSCIMVETPPEFKNTPQHLSTKEKRDYFNKEINQFILNNFNVSQGHLGLTGRQRIHILFTIDSIGYVEDIKIRARHIKYKKEAERVLKKLPTFIPAKNRGKNVPVTYTLPIIFNIDE